jgi:hypothetical protein
VSRFYEYESQFGRLLVEFVNQTLQGLIGTEKKDRREKKKYRGSSMDGFKVTQRKPSILFFITFVDDQSCKMV